MLRRAARRRPREDPDLTAVLLLYALTLFTGATLLFVMQPMVGKMILPLLGGTPAVWSTCMVFFQAALLGGYAYAHALTARVRPSRDPYFLYAASNLGSMLALLGYPTLVEPHLHLQGSTRLSQTALWSLGYATLAILIALCALTLWWKPAAAPGPTLAGAETAPAPVEGRPRWPRRIHWVVLAFVPSSLLLGITTYITTDLAAVPLLWVLPLAIYLMVSALPERIWVIVLWHFALLFVIALACHGALALDRPGPLHLTEFYLLISVGGVLGDLFSALLAVAAAVLLTVVLYSESATLRVDFAFLARVLDLSSERVSEWLDPAERLLNKLLIYGPPLVVAWFLRRRPLHLGLALASVLLISGFVDARNSDQIRQSRSFFGVLRISRDRDPKGYTELRHGTTLHGRQSLEPSRRAEPLSYYQRKGPIGQLFVELDRRPGAVRMAVIGLGTGTLAAYARPGDRVTFYEIDRLVRDVAFDPAYFTYATDARDRGVTMRLELGDARIRMEAVKRDRPEERYDVILVDAFSSDAIPVHLLTREALRLYFDLLGPRGILALHISNRYLRLEPVVAALAEDGRYARMVQHGDSGDIRGGVEASWAILARRPEDFGEMASDARWTAAHLDVEPAVSAWTDDFHNLLSVFKW